MFNHSTLQANALVVPLLPSLDMKRLQAVASKRLQQESSMLKVSREELKCYLTDPLIVQTPGFDVLLWWKVCYPLLIPFIYSNCILGLLSLVSYPLMYCKRLPCYPRVVSTL